MELWLDTVDEDVIRTANSTGLFYGITTNPSIIALSEQPLAKIIPFLLEVQEGPIAIQVAHTDARDMFEQGIKLHEISDRILIKVPVTHEGLVTLHQLHQEGVTTIATAVYHPNQFLLAALAGSEYAAPYYGRMADAGIDAIETIDTMIEIGAQYGFETKLLVASIRSTHQITELAKMGVYAATIKEELFSQLLADNPLTLQILDSFNRDWKKFNPGAFE